MGCSFWIDQASNKVFYWKEKTTSPPESSNVPKLTNQDLFNAGWVYKGGISLPIPTERLYGCLTAPVNKMLMSLGKQGGWKEVKVMVGYTSNGFDRLGFWGLPLGWQPVDQNIQSEYDAEGVSASYDPSNPDQEDIVVGDSPLVEAIKEGNVLPQTTITGYTPYMITTNQVATSGVSGQINWKTYLPLIALGVLFFKKGGRK